MLHHAVMLCPLPLAEVTDGAEGWSQFVRSVGDAMSRNQALLPLVGLGLLALFILFANWKLAGWLERVLRRHHKHREQE